MTTIDPAGLTPKSWLAGLRAYFLFIGPVHLVWEVLQLPLYTIWQEGSPSSIAFAVLHCTAGDALIAAAAILMALLAAGDGWPAQRRVFIRVALIATAIGVSYTVFSEWLNIVIRKSWAYSALMPVTPFFDTGLSPLLQWVAIPLGGFWFVRRRLVTQALSRR